MLIGEARGGEREIQPAGAGQVWNQSLLDSDS
jgi:hypothetical protein